MTAGRHHLTSPAGAAPTNALSSALFHHDSCSQHMELLTYPTLQTCLWLCHQLLPSNFQMIGQEQMGFGAHRSRPFTPDTPHRKQVMSELLPLDNDPLTNIDTNEYNLDDDTPMPPLLPYICDTSSSLIPPQHPAFTSIVAFLAHHSTFLEPPSTKWTPLTLLCTLLNNTFKSLNVLKSTRAIKPPLVPSPTPTPFNPTPAH